MYHIHVYENPQDRGCHVNQPAAIRFPSKKDCRKFILVRDVGDFLRTVRLTQWKVKMNKGPAIRNLDENDYILVVIWQFASWDPDTPKNIHKFTTMETSLWKKIHNSPDLNLKCCCPVLAIQHSLENPRNVKDKFAHGKRSGFVIACYVQVPEGTWMIILLDEWFVIM